MKEDLSEYVDYGMTVMRDICDNIGFRTCGTEGEHKSTEKIASEYKSISDEVLVEDFQVANAAYPKGVVPLIGVFFTASVILYYIIPALSWISLIPFLLFASETFLLKKAVDWMFKKQTSHNVVAKIKPKKETKTIMCFMGHQDSPFIFPITAKYRKKGMLITIGVVVSTLLFILLSIIRAFMSLSGEYPVLFPQSQERGGEWIGLDSFATILAIIATPAGVYFSRYFISNEKSLGANDNLSGTVGAMGLSKYFYKPENRPDNVEIWCIAFGSEEAGERGSEAFSIKHKAELLEKDAYLVNLESIGGGDELVIVTVEKMCIPSRKHHPDVIKLLEESATAVEKDMTQKHKWVVHDMDQGYTDAEAVSREGLKASSLIGLNFDGFPLIWHHKDDTPDIIQPTMMEDSMRICIQAVKIRDKQVGK